MTNKLCIRCKVVEKIELKDVTDVQCVTVVELKDKKKNNGWKSEVAEHLLKIRQKKRLSYHNLCRWFDNFYGEGVFITGQIRGLTWWGRN